MTAASLASSLTPMQLSASASTSTLQLPSIGLGTCCDDYDDSRQTILAGLAEGYRLIDTAAHYESEVAVGDAIVEARRRGIIKDASAVTTVTKVWFDDMGFEPTLASAKRSMSNLQTEQLDVVLVHFPGTIDSVQSPARNRKIRAETWRALETLLADGRCRAIGVSNYSRRHLKETLASCSVAPMLMQCELHPRLPQTDLVDYARSNGVETIMAHCPLAHGSPALLGHPTLLRLSQARGQGCTPAALCLRWSMDRGLVPIPKSSSQARLRENRAAASMPPLSAEERAAIDLLEASGPDARVSFDPALIA